MHVLVCGGRDYQEKGFALLTLDSLHEKSPISLIIHGAARGADSFAGHWANMRGVAQKAYPANWALYGGHAGHVRNAKMLRDNLVHLVLVFPGGAGTRDMVARAMEARIPILRASSL